MSESAFFQDLAMLMTIAGAVAVIFARLRWPKVLGYILVGIIMSEYTWGGGFISNVESARTIGQLGVVFLMFGMGLSFSSRDMVKIRAVALPAAIIDTLIMIWLGYIIGTKVMGWGAVPSFFLGVAICDSATTLLAKVIDEMNWGSRPFAKYVLGTSICEDIICVGAIAVATGFANGGGMSASSFFASLAGLGVFFLTVLVAGYILVPRLLLSVSKRNDDESLVLALLGCCFFVSYIAYRFNYSLALGAFLVGLIGASSDVRDKLARLVEPLKSMFAAVFFVSIGLLVNPIELWQNLPMILLISVVVIIGKAFNNFMAAILSGIDIKTSVQMAFSLAQIGEFAFMVAILYADLSEDGGGDMFPIAIGVSLLTTLLNPFMIRISDRVGNFAERKAPEKVKKWLNSYNIWLEKLMVSADRREFIRLKNFALKLGVYAILILSTSVVCSILYRFDYTRFSSFFERYDRLFFFAIANVFSIAMLPMIVFAARGLGDEVAVLLAGDGNNKWQMSVRQLIRLFILCAVMVLFFFEWALLNVATFPGERHLFLIVLAIIIGIGLVGWRFFLKAGRRATQRFNDALSAEERREGFKKMMTITIPEGTLNELKLGANSPAIGGNVVTLNIRAKTGASIVSVIRGGKAFRNIGPDWEFQIGDVLVAIGDAHEIAALKDLLGVMV